MNTILKLLRCNQYVKNLFIILPLFFAGQITNHGLMVKALLAFVAFSVTASSIYILNDVLDAEDDRRHPIKKYRPLASGAVSKRSAVFLMLALLVAGVSMMSTVGIRPLIITAAYVLTTVCYSFRLKHIAILDVIIIAMGFVLRLFVGSFATSIPLSIWIVIMTFLLALFIALAKRRDDVLIYNDTGRKVRRAVDGYNLQFIDSSMTVMASVVIVAYLLYATSKDSVARMHYEYLYLTTVFVIMGIMRYLQIVFSEQRAGSPTMIVLTDSFMQVTILAWVLTFAWIIYL